MAVLSKTCGKTKTKKGVVIDPDVYVLKMKLEEGEMLPFFLHDIIKGYLQPSRSFQDIVVQGVECQPFRRHYNRSNGKPPKSTKGGSNYPPMPFMNIARIGNFVDETRQSSYFHLGKRREVYTCSTR